MGNYKQCMEMEVEIETEAEVEMGKGRNIILRRFYIGAS